MNVSGFSKILLSLTHFLKQPKEIWNVGNQIVPYVFKTLCNGNQELEKCFHEKLINLKMYSVCIPVEAKTFLCGKMDASSEEKL